MKRGRADPARWFATRREHRSLRRQLALAEQDGFDRFGNAVSTNGFAAIACDQHDYQAADCGNHDYPETKGISRRRATVERQGLEEEKIGEKTDQVEQDIGRDRA